MNKATKTLSDFLTAGRFTIWYCKRSWNGQFRSWSLLEELAEELPNDHKLPNIK